MSMIGDDYDRDYNRRLWEMYVREMSIFYFDLLVEFLVALSKCGNFSVDDVIFLNDVLGKSYLCLYVDRGIHGEGRSLRRKQGT